MELLKETVLERHDPSSGSGSYEWDELSDSGLRERMNFPIGIRENGRRYEASEVEEYLAQIRALGRQADDTAETGSEEFTRITG